MFYRCTVIVIECLKSISILAFSPVLHSESKDATAQCTLVAISCKDFGAKLLPSWTTPFTEQLRSGKDSNKYKVVRITINEGRIAKILSPLIVSGTKKNVPKEDHENTLLYYGDAEEMRDILRMHNVYTGYVYLVDGEFIAMTHFNDYFPFAGIIQ